MDQILLITLNGLTLAAVYFLVASGLTLIFGLMRVITMAHGTSYLLGGYVGYTIAKATGNWFLGALGAAVAIGVLGLFIHQVLIRRFQDDDMRVALITLGVSLIGTDLMLATFGGTATQVPVPDELQVASVAIPGVGSYPVLRLLVLALAIVIGVALALVITRTRFGSIVRAGVDDSRMTAATGVNVRLVFAAIFVLGSALAALAGVVGGTLFPLLPGQDGVFLLYSLVVVIVGGMGSIPGAALGAALVGLVSQFALVYAPTYSLVLTFALMVVVLAVRPQGLMGRAA
ncbi:branched-chain amino acid ABC transporter permease [Protaetiibacter intestinalis]|uniref:Branched-chain amino acid ABC transporter permease n=1 Tax=Protaetiibacter intestinalis TaxID=2419774 RepID=A0A387B6D2_9MICO|nr:branched-chain amino acid ABC transporter permease [Protaetiibacter intestinalis]AYF97311.1 branched-chain amino acid ABC transporter permease [Protaetiibacter intestinalis]